MAWTSLTYSTKDFNKTDHDFIAKPLRPGLQSRAGIHYPAEVNLE